MELLSDTYKHLQNIDEDGDLEILKTCLKLGETGSGDGKCSKKKVKKVPKPVVQKNSKKTPTSKKKIQEDASATSHSSSAEDNSEADNDRSEMITHLEKKLGHPQKDKQRRSSKNYANSNEEDESLHQNLACRQSHSKRPSTPQRPITVPRQGGSTEDLSFKKGGGGGGRSAPARAPILDAYYYSQSEEEDHHHRRKPKGIGSPPPPSHEIPLTPKKCVTFKDKPGGAYQSNYKYNSNYANYSTSGGDHPTSIRNYFPGGLAGAAVKKYC